MALLGRHTDSLLVPPGAFGPGWRIALCCLALLFSGLDAAGSGRDLAAPEELEAVFLLNLARFVKWPAHAFPHEQAPFVIGVIGKASLLPALRRATHGELISGRAIVCRELRAAGEVPGCQLVFVGADAVVAVAAHFDDLLDHSILLVSDTEGFLALGGHAQFFTRHGRMRLRLAPANFRRAELHASAQLLRVAEVMPQAETSHRR